MLLFLHVGPILGSIVWDQLPAPLLPEVQMRQVLTRPAVSPHPLMSAITVLTTLLVGSVMLGTFVATWIVVADACVSALFGAAAGAMTPISGTLGAGALTTLVVFRN